MFDLINKFFNKKKYYENKIDRKNKIKKLNYLEIIKPRLKLISENINKKDTISFLHSGHLGDIINSLPLIKEISKSKECNLYIQYNKKILNNLDQKHPFGNFYLSEYAAKKIIPLLKKQKYLKKVSIYDQTPIDIDLDFFRDLGLNFNIDSIRWYFHLAASHCDLTKPYVFVNEHKYINNKIVILRSMRRQNKLINYKFLNDYKDLLFIGLKDEYISLKKEIPLLK